MAGHVWEIEINSETPQEDLERCVLAAEHSSDVNLQRTTAKARAEMLRRERQLWTDRFDAESKERVKAQQFQESQVTRQIEAQKDSVGHQLAVAEVQSKTASRAAMAAWASALAAFGLLALSALQMCGGTTEEGATDPPTAGPIKSRG